MALSRKILCGRKRRWSAIGRWTAPSSASFRKDRAQPNHHGNLCTRKPAVTSRYNKFRQQVNDSTNPSYLVSLCFPPGEISTFQVSFHKEIFDILSIFVLQMIILGFFEQRKMLLGSLSRLSLVYYLPSR